MKNTAERFELRNGDRFVLHELNGGPKTVCTSDLGDLYTAEHRSRQPGRHVGPSEVLEALQDVLERGGRGKTFRARFVTGPDQGRVIRVHTNHAWPFCRYLGAPAATAEAEANRQAEAVERPAPPVGPSEYDPAPTPEAKPTRSEASSLLPVYDERAPKRPTNVSLNSDLLAKAKRFGINLSQELEMRLVEVVKARLREEWLEANGEAIEAYNIRIARDGGFGDDVRRF